MRKYFLSFVALAAGLFATSCQESIVEPQIAGPTTFTVQLPNQMGTKAFGDATSTNVTINSLFVEVYSEGGNTLIYKPQVIEVKEGKATFTANLIQDQKYDIIFWAQKGNAYNTSDLRSIPMNNRAHNVDDGAAFFAFLNDFVPTGASQPVVLRRPFAQLNLGTTDESLVTNAGTVKLSQSSIQVEKVAATFNTVLGVGEGEQTVQFALANVPTIKLNVGGVEYNYVSMDYLPIAGDDQALVNVNAQITLDNGQLIDHTFTSVPVRENYRTNIVGNLISSTTDFNITIEEGFVDENGNSNPDNNYTIVSTPEELQEAINNGVNNIILEEDINLDGSLNFGVPPTSPIGRASATEAPSFVLDLGGNTITTNLQSEGRHYYAINNYANLTIKGNGTINARGISNYGVLTLENGTINAIDGNGGYAVKNYQGSEFIMNGGTLATTLEDDNLVNNGGFDATTLSVDEGATATINGGIIKNICDFTMAIENRGTTTINGGEITSVHSTVANYATMTINGGSYKCNGLEGITAHVLYVAGGQVEINGGKFDGKDNYNGFNVDASAGSYVSIKGGEFLPVHSGSLYGDGTITVSGGTFFDDPSVRLADGYKAVEAADGETYVVLPNTDNYDIVITDPAQLNNVVLGNNTNILLQLAAREYTIELYANITDSDSRNLTIIGTEGTKVKFANQQVRLQLFKNFTIKNCEILHMATKSWGHIVFASGNKADGVYTIENCTFNGVGTQGIYINETITGATYNIKNCTFNGDFGTEGAITISTHQGVNHTVNVTGCKFNNVPADHRIFLTRSGAGLFYDFTLNTDLEATTNNEVAMFIALCNADIKLAAGQYKIDLYNIKYRENLTITGTDGTRVEFADKQVVTYRFKNLTIQDCEILPMLDKGWSMLAFGGGSTSGSVYTIKNCTFNGVGTNGIYINEGTSGIRYDIINCTFNGNFGKDLAVAIQNNQDVNHSVNVTNCTFNNSQGQEYDVKVFYNYPGLSLDIVGDGQVLWEQGELQN